MSKGGTLHLDHQMMTPSHCWLSVPFCVEGFPVEMEEWNTPNGDPFYAKCCRLVGAQHIPTCWSFTDDYTQYLQQGQDSC
ncbi:hypothetical protein SLA2020_045830 [Shorea laevis]